MKPIDSSLPPSARTRDQLLLVGSRFLACFLLFMHVPGAIGVGSAHWIDTIAPSAAMACLHFFNPIIVRHRGAMAGAIWMVSVSTVQTTWLAFWVGAASGMQYYFFAISGVALFLFHGFPRAWAIVFAVLPVFLFAMVEIVAKGDGAVVRLDPAVADWLSVANALGSFNILILIGLLFSRATTQAELLLASEKERSERLLLNILPEPIANRLKSGGENVIADRIDDVSVMFADLVGFTPYARGREPTAVVGMLNTLFSRFDAEVKGLKLEKIKTVGDAYMVVAGAPSVRADHLSALANLALALVREVDAFRDGEGHRFAIRIGLHVGPVVTGVIGTEKMAYDVWGDTVNIASRLESSSLPGQIQVSPAVVERLSSSFTFESRGEIEIKGVGVMATSFLTGSAHLISVERPHAANSAGSPT